MSNQDNGHGQDGQINNDQDETKSMDTFNDAQLYMNPLTQMNYVNGNKQSFKDDNDIGSVMESIAVDPSSGHLYISSTNFRGKTLPAYITKYNDLNDDVLSNPVANLKQNNHGACSNLHFIDSKRTLLATFDDGYLCAYSQDLKLLDKPILMNDSIITGFAIDKQNEDIVATCGYDGRYRFKC